MLRFALVALLLTGCTLPPDPSTWTPSVGRAAWDGPTGSPIPVPAGLSSLEALADVSSWQLTGFSDSRLDGGTYGVGNGIVFGIIGLDSPWNTLTGAVGPGYQRTDGFFGDSWVDLTDGAQVLPLDDEQVQRPRRSAVTRTLSRSGDVVLMTTDAAVPGQAVILRHVALRNEGPEAATVGFEIGLAGDSDAVDGGLEQTRGDREMRISCPDLGAIEAAVELAPGAQFEVTCFHSFRRTDDDAFPLPTAAAAELLALSLEATQQFLAIAAELSTPDPRVADLYEGMLITMFTQTADIGVVSPMNRYTSGWLRDNDGPVRLYMRAGLFSEARTILEAIYQVMTLRQSISNSFGLDQDLSAFEEPADPAAFWADATFMPGREPTEAPSYLPLLWWEYARLSGDVSLLAEGRRPFLEACLRRQERSDQDLLRFSGDETYWLVMSLAIGGEPASLGWSAQSSFLFAAAAERTVELGGDPALADMAADVRAAAEATYRTSGGFYSPIAWFDGGVFRQPFEDVSLYPLWTGYGDPADPAQVENVAAIVDLLMRDDGVPVSEAPDGSGPIAGHTGMVAGLFLQNVAAVHHEVEELAFDGLGAVATPSGHFEEGHRSSDHAPLAGLHRPDGLGSDSPARYRPWEGGDAVAGMLDYLLGLDYEPFDGRITLSPHLPAGWPWLEARGLRVGDARYDLTLTGYEEGLLLDLGRGVGGVIDLTLHADRAIASVWIDGAKLTIEPGEVVLLEGLEWPTSDPLRIVAVYD